MTPPTLRSNYSSRNRYALASATALLVRGCAQFQSATDEGHRRETVEQFSRLDQHSNYPAIRRESFEQVNLLELWLAQKARAIAMGRRGSANFAMTANALIHLFTKSLIQGLLTCRGNIQSGMA